jgi:hypothetical protein
LVLALSPEARRRDADVEVLRRIHGETANQRGEEKKEGSRRERRVPGTRGRPRRRKGMTEATGFLVGARSPWRRSGVARDDLGRPRFDFLYGKNKEREAELVVASVHRGVVGDGGSARRKARYYGSFSFSRFWLAAEENREAREACG